MVDRSRYSRARPYYLNSFLSPAFASLPVMLRWLGAIPRRPLVIAPRGELHPGALRFKRAKKAAFLQLARRLPAYRDLLWQAGSPVERDHIRRHFDGARIAVARDLTALAGCTPASPPAPKRRGQLSVAHLSVVSPGKNLLTALRMVGRLSGDVTLTVYGPVLDREYFGQCVERARDLPPNVRVKFEGEVPHERVVDTLCSHHALLLPTVAESFGHAVLEALVAGCLLVISDRTLWRDLACKEVGWDLPLADEASFVRALQSCVDMGDEEFARRSALARALGMAEASSPTALEDNRAMFQSLAVARR